MKYEIKKNISLLDALIEMAPDSSKSSLRSWLKTGRVMVDDEVVKNGSTELWKGQTVSIGTKPQFIQGEVRILYQDQYLVAIDKPKGLLSVSTDYTTTITAHAYLKNKFRPKNVYPVHRLDQDTSGVMIFALTEKARDNLKKTFESHDIERRYTALVEGRMAEKSGTWRSYLVEDANFFVYTTTDPEKGKLAITHYQVKAEGKKYTLLELELETGKKNQIRVHCKEAGHSIVGDKKYGASTNPVQRVCLHAQFLVLKHPISGKLMRFESPVPLEFKKLIT